MPTNPDSYRSYTDALDLAYKNYDTVNSNTLNRLHEASDYVEENLSPKNNEYSYTDYLLERNVELEKVRKSSEDETLYGFIPGKWLPNWVKDGYNRSITGLTEQVVSGNERFDLGNYKPETLEDIGATIISFIQPLDFATMAAGGGVGGFAAKQALKAGAKEALKKGLSKTATNKIVANKLDDLAVKQILGNAPNRAIQIMTGNGVAPTVAKKAVEQAAPRVVHKVLIEGATGATGLGFYQGLATGAMTKIETGDFDEVMALKEGVKGTALGAATAGTGPIIRSALKNLNPATQTLAVKAVETASFGTLAPVLSGEDINVEGYIHAAGVIGGLTAQKAALKYAKKGIDSIKAKQYENAMDAETTARYIMEGTNKEFHRKSGRNIIESQEIFTDRYGTEFDRVFINEKKKIVKLRNKETRKTDELNYDQFDQLLFRRKSKAKTEKGLAISRNNQINNIRKELNIDQKRFNEYIDSSRLQTPSETVKNKYSLNSLNGVERLKLLNEMRHEKRVIDLSTQLEKAGWEGSLLPKKRFLDQVFPSLPKFWRQTKNRATTQLEQLSFQDFDRFNARELTLTGDIIQQFRSSGVFKGGIFKTKKLLDYNKSLADKLEDPRYASMKNKDLPDFKKVQEIKKTLNYIWDLSQRAGIDLGPREQYYFPRMIKPEFLGIFNKDIANFSKQNSELAFNKNLPNNKDFQKLINVFIETNQFDPATVKALQKIAKVDPNVKQKTRAEIAERNRKIARAFYDLNRAVTTQFINTAKNLEIARKGVEIPKEFMERDTRLVLTRYAKQAANRIAYVETFGAKGERITSRISALHKSANDALKANNLKLSTQLNNSSRLLKQLFSAATNDIETNPSYNWKTPTAKKFWGDIVDFQIGTKIGLGFATIPNITQTFISTAIRTGYKPLAQATYNLSLNPVVDAKTGLRYRDAIRKSGVSNLSVFQMISNLEPSDRFMGRFADITTRVSQFQRINEFNQILSAAAAREWILALRKTANGKSALLDTGIKLPQLLGGARINRRQWAIKTLNELGFADHTKTPSQRQLYEAMYRFSRDSQLQRNVLTEPLVSLDPRWRPFFLFKKFGYKQFNWIREQMSAEVSRGNLFPMLRLGLAGMAGGEFVGYARDALAEWIAGNEVYDTNRYMFPYLLKGTKLSSVGSDQFVEMSEFTIDDYVDRFASVGAFGVIGDIVANENKIRAIEFAFKPAIVQDFDKIWSAMTRTIEDTKDYGIGTAKRIPKYISPVLGTAPRRFLERFEPMGQRAAYVKRIKQLRLGDIKDAIIDGNSEKAVRLINDYNRTYGSENPIMYDDYDADSITNRIINRIKKRQENIRRSNP
jgi:DNA-binding transcriptional regulator YiaG